MLQQIEESIRVHEAVKQLVPHLEAMVQRLVACLQSGGTVYFCGNGGSAADAQHWAAELSGRFRRNRPALSAVALGMNASELTAIANDFSYDDIFARPLSALGRQGDVLIAISTSGNSPNVVHAMRIAWENGMTTMAFTGEGGGNMKAFADHWIEIPATDTARIQEAHELCGHLLCAAIETQMFGD